MFYEAAGVAGVDPAGYQVRHVVWMAQGRLKREWDQTALIASAAWNAIRDPKKRRRPFTPLSPEMNPYAKETAPGGAKDKLAFKPENSTIIGHAFRSLRKRRNG